MEPAQIAVPAFGGDAAEAAQETLDLAVATGGRLDVHGPARPPLRLLSAKVSLASPTPSSIAAREASPSGTVSSSMLETQSRNRARSIVLLPMVNASRNPV